MKEAKRSAIEEGDFEKAKLIDIEDDEFDDENLD
jgi:hypothetical protein